MRGILKIQFQKMYCGKNTLFNRNLNAVVENTSRVKTNTIYGPETPTEWKSDSVRTD